MAIYNVYITESKNYETQVEAESYEAALSAAIGTDTTTLIASIDKSVIARLA